MTATFARLERAFAEAVELTAEEQARFLAELATRAPELARRLDALLRSDDEIRDAATDAFGRLPSPTADRSGFAFGAYTLRETIGQGGMGTVYRAERTDGTMAHEIAVKVLHHAHADSETMRRFRIECQVLAHLEHPAIARFVEAGTLSDGTPCLAMELVRGVPIVEYCTAHNLSVVERLRMFREVCDAVRYAHRHLVV
ncbi:MAG: protein kinase, partial [Myxococcota bacterium]